jgi:beta-N-acetylhexosaminidase
VSARLPIAAAAAAAASALALPLAGCGADDTGTTAAPHTTRASMTVTTDDPAPRPPARLTLRQTIGQRMVFAYSGTTPPRALKQRIRRGEAAGVILFARNVAGPAALARQMRALQALRPKADDSYPLLVMVDQEGGAVRRLPGSPQRGAAQTRDRRDAGALGRGAARTLKRAGVNVDLAPVLDVARPGSAMAAEGRSYGRDPQRVASLASWFAGALRGANIAPVYKHFPGFGAARVNTDDAAARIDLPLAELRAVDLEPYKKVSPDAVMVSTAVYPKVDPRPAAFSRRWVTQELRERLKYGDVVTMTDDLQTPAVVKYGSPAQLAFFAMRAGVDLPIFAKDYTTGARAAAGLEKAVRSGALSRGELEAGAARVRDWRLDFTIDHEHVE